jgi:hypothetical protein
LKEVDSDLIEIGSQATIRAPELTFRATAQRAMVCAWMSTDRVVSNSSSQMEK